MALKYLEVAQDIAKKINTGAYTNKLPSEGQLMQLYGVSRNTIRNALNALFNQGMLKRIQGSGYFVNEALYHNHDIINMANKYGLRDLEKDAPIQSKTLFLEIIPADAKLAAHLKIKPQSEVYHLKRLRLRQDELICLEESFYRRDLVPYLTTDICNGSIFHFIKEQFNIVGHVTDTYLSLHYTTPAENELTNIPVNQAAIKVEEVHSQKNEQPFDYSISYYYLPDVTFYARTVNHLNN
ncbi:GntR family transcriptional regulator, transcriptional regulator of bglA [Ligilactobacillus sp. WC1T17]|uniref:GntR family transcriptional regulator, transcriptional regulator of bglA n=1 Tax=Ligilactobacillus ruminis TaxID=1623 RepID=A0ABY1AAI0_9LACO|nr:GntR family transcriptional regulator, transcriptional regulator of bglA [Ligilactobacillus ruminis]